VQIGTRYFGEHVTGVDVVLYAICGRRIQSRQWHDQREWANHMSRSHNVWLTFITLDENKVDLARFLSDVIMTKGKE